MAWAARKGGSTGIVPSRVTRPCAVLTREIMLCSTCAAASNEQQPACMQDPAAREGAS